MSLPALLKRFGVDPYLLLLVVSIGVAVVIPARGAAADIVGQVGDWAIAFLFFLYGARLKPSAIIGGLTNWKLQLLVFLSTFVLFPLLGVGLVFALQSVLPAELLQGLLFLCLVPSTVQSSIAFTAIARGNVPAAICAATLSNMVGVFITPALVALLLHVGGASIGPQALLDIAIQLLLPFVLGQVARPWLEGFLTKHRARLALYDRGTVLLIVYSAFSAGVVAGVWNNTSVQSLIGIAIVDVALLMFVLAFTTYSSRLLGFSKEDEIAIVFCGTKKSIASGIPMASALFAGHGVSLIVLPLMLFHQAQLFACAIIAQRYARQGHALEQKG
ncbi:MAG: hypothetical protein JWN11_1270 [Hyphomicrobiales bacterium]|nr:hypothetical protein [Hyphomicrobiales bacterium]